MYRIIVIDEENDVVEINHLVRDIYMVTTNEQCWPTQYVLRSEEDDHGKDTSTNP